MFTEFGMEATRGNIIPAELDQGSEPEKSKVLGLGLGFSVSDFLVYIRVWNSDFSDLNPNLNSKIFKT